jgi:hypothetical protein
MEQDAEAEKDPEFLDPIHMIQLENVDVPARNWWIPPRSPSEFSYGGASSFLCRR